MKLPTLHQTAAEHKAADARCGREWLCTCAACLMVRDGCRTLDEFRRTPQFRKLRKKIK